ncbi:MAG: hypothetical protein OEQ29_08910 [Alphaproteobacteria bacterium]|nr:hypothetical protein [Alphaproteobacteria bacterium]
MTVDQFKEFIREIIDDASATLDPMVISIALDELSNEFDDQIIIKPGPKFYSEGPQ